MNNEHNPALTDEELDKVAGGIGSGSGSIDASVKNPCSPPAIEDLSLSADAHSFTFKPPILDE